MKAKEFAEMCYAEKEIQLKEYMNGNESLVTKLKNDLALSTEQEKILYKLVDTVLTDTYLTLLYALDGTMEDKKILNFMEKMENLFLILVN